MIETKKRRSDRVLMTLPVSVSGTDIAGKPFAENATTVTVSQHGAGIALKTALVAGQKIVLRRQRVGASRAAECRVVGRGGVHAGTQTFSVAFVEPAPTFWDIYFPSLPADKDTAGRTLLSCKACGTRKIAHLNSEELAVFNAHRQLSLGCAHCGKSTIWQETHEETATTPEVEPGNPERLAALPSPPPENQRKHRRLAADVLVCVRQAGWEDDIATTEDISRGGLSFTSTRHYLVGSFVKVAAPYLPDGGNIFADARVAHSSKVPSQNLYLNGIMYLAEYDPSR